MNSTRFDHIIVEDGQVIDWLVTEQTVKTELSPGQDAYSGKEAVEKLIDLLHQKHAAWENGDEDEQGMALLERALAEMSNELYGTRLTLDG